MNIRDVNLHYHYFGKYAIKHALNQRHDTTVDYDPDEKVFWIFGLNLFVLICRKRRKVF